MPFTVTMPKLSPTMEDGVIVKWHKKENDFVEAGELLFEVATDKATVEYNALDEGWIRKILVTDGQDATVNQPVAILTVEKNESIESYQVPSLPAAVQEATAPAEGANAAPAASKAVESQTTSRAGVMKQPSFMPEPPLEDYAFSQPREQASDRIKASPLARKLAKEKGVDLSTVQGTGPNQRVMSRDLEKAQSGTYVAFGHREKPQIVPGTYEEESLSPMRKTIGRRLQEAKTFIPHFYITQSVNAEPLMAVREQLMTGGIKVSVNDIIVRACALALREHPNVNSGFYPENESVIRFKTIDIAIAVSVDGGLITPVVRHADFKNVGEISTEVKALAKKARIGKLEPHEYKGGSFTISNLGMYGIAEFQAIINPPQAAILAIAAIQDLPVVRQGQICVGKVMNISLSADHRVIDGVAGAEFLVTLKKILENPSLVLI